MIKETKEQTNKQTKEQTTSTYYILLILLGQQSAEIYT